MAKKNFLLLSLEDSKTKKIANIVSNESCRKILDHLLDKEATESEIAKALNIPISTVHYNLRQLTDAGLLIAEEFHYSEKGKEVYHYKLANKYIIIAPKKTSGIREKLMGILPAALIAAGAAGIIQLVNNYFSKTVVAEDFAVAKSAMVQESALAMAAEAPAGQAAPLLTQNLALWFLMGALFALLIYLIIGMIRKDFNR
ncbi:helix-turn-helix transcriptional regulator [Candidatus Woesearchaeota archaeon]|nr:helix-turn-helix transcriptional regulator [Candidatus Woesearchaeota archaeon]